jgi:hypothetical protein
MMFSMIQALGLFIHPIKSAADFLACSGPSNNAWSSPRCW